MRISLDARQRAGSRSDMGEEQPLCRTTHGCGHEPEVRARRLEGGEAASVWISESASTLGVAEWGCPPLLLQDEVS